MIKVHLNGLVLNVIIKQILASDWSMQCSSHANICNSDGCDTPLTPIKLYSVIINIEGDVSSGVLGLPGGKKVLGKHLKHLFHAMYITSTYRYLCT